MRFAWPPSRLRAVLIRLPVLLALAVLAVLPPGVMPSRTPAGQMVMVICSEHGPVEAVFDPATGELTELPGDDQAPCHWAVSHPVAVLTAPATLPLPALATRRAAPALAVALWRPAHDPRGLYARGPPTFG